MRHDADDLLHAQAPDHRRRRELVDPDLFEDLPERAAPVHEPEQRVHVVGDLGQPLGQEAVVDLDDGAQIRELSHGAAPHVGAPEPLQDQRVGRSDARRARHRLELDGESALRPA